MSSRISFNFSKDLIKKKVLSNGMTIISYPMKSVPKVLVQIAYDVGSAVEEQGEKGLAHLVEHMIFKGTEKLQEGAIDSIARKYGAELNAFTSSDVTSYYFEVDKQNWKNFVPLLADCMKNVVFDSEHLASEVKAVVQELNMYKDRHVSRMVQLALDLGFPSNHPYHHPTIGYKEDLASVTAENLKRFYKKYYHPERAVLFIVGDMDADDAIAYAEQHFSDIPHGGSQEFDKFPAYVHNLTVHSSRIYEHVQQEVAVFYWVIPGLKAGAELVVQAIQAVLGGGEGSRLYQALVDDAQVADDVGVEAYTMLHGGLFLIVVEPKKGKLDLCRQIISAEITNLIVNGASDLELKKFTSKYASQFVRSVESTSGLVDAWIESYFTTRDEFDVFEKLNKIESVSSNEIRGFTANHLDPFLMSVIEVVPFVKSKEFFWERSQAYLKYVEAHILQTHQRTTPVVEPVIPEEYAHPQKCEFLFPRPTYKTVTSNGLEIVAQHDASLPLATMALQFRDGSFFASAKEGRLVGLMMGTLLEGSTRYSKKELLDFYELHGVSFRLDSYGAHVSLLSANHVDVFDRFLHMVFNPKFDSSSVEHVKALTIAGLERSKDSPTDVANRLLRCSVYKDTPNDWSVDEMIAEIKKITVADLKKMHTALIRPEMMVASIVGEYDHDAVTSLLEKYFGTIDMQSYVPRTIGASHFNPAEKIDFKMQRDQAVLLMGQPSKLTLFHKDYAVIKLLNLIAFYSLGSRLYQLREQTGLFYSASGGFASGATLEPGHDSVFAILNPSTLEESESSIRLMIDELAQHGVREDELAAAQQMFLKQTIDLIATSAERASLFAAMRVFNLPEDYYDQMIIRVQSMTVDEVNRIAAEYFSLAQMARVRVGMV
ncbi:insulinase family protein [Candidatus Dependentiae bacterium]|nr:insulinase family protein [Candidatus Dependentiae bacterium]